MARSKADALNLNLKAESLTQYMPEASHLGFGYYLHRHEAVTFTLELPRPHRHTRTHTHLLRTAIANLDVECIGRAKRPTQKIDTTKTNM